MASLNSPLLQLPTSDVAKHVLFGQHICSELQQNSADLIGQVFFITLEKCYSLRLRALIEKSK